jgi:hypothetical protein
LLPPLAAVGAYSLEVRELLNFCGVKSFQMTWAAFFAKILNCPLATMIFRLIADGNVSGWSFGLLLATAHSDTNRGPELVQGQVVDALKSSRNSDDQEVDQLEIEAVMGSALESMTRYQAKLKRDLCRSIETLRTVQAERREGEK